MKPGTEARVTAGRILGRVLREGAYSNRAIDPETRGLPERDVRLVRWLVYGSLRRLLQVDRALTAVSKRPLAQIQPEVLDLLRVGGYELLFSNAGRHGIVDSGVEAVREVAGERPVGFANAVLRNLAREGEPPIAADDDALAAGVDPWLFDAVAAAHGPEPAKAFFEAANRDASIGVWAPGGPPPDASTTAVTGIPEAYYLDDAAALDAVLAAGAMVVDPSSTAVAAAVAAQPGEYVLDQAAAPGNKTAQLWEAMKGTGRLVAVDAHEKRLARSQRRLAKLGVTPEWVAADARHLGAEYAGADRVLLDAPCTGLGTLRRRPEIRHRLAPSSPAEMAVIQHEMLAAALRLVRPGGRVVYSVCTLFVEETLDVTAGHDAAPAEDLPGAVWEHGRLLGPHLTGTDGMFISVIGE